MADPLRVLMVSSEVASLARTGGLGDVVEGLALGLAAGGTDVVIVTPKYAITKIPSGTRAWNRRIAAPLGLGHIRQLGVLEGALGDPRRPTVRACMLTDDQLFEREGIYGDRFGTFGDNAFRFAALSSGALALAPLLWNGALPDVLHAHDWHGALSVLYARASGDPAWGSVRRLFTIHNLAFQGVVGAGELDYLAIARDAWDRGSVRHDGRINLMKGAIEFADAVTTVSATYAAEIQRPGHGYGLDAHLRWHSSKLVGIVNGIDTGSFDPQTDPAIPRRYGIVDAADGRSVCKRSLLTELGLSADPPGPVFALVSRLDWLKGVDRFLAVLPALVQRGGRAVLVGTGEAALERALREAAARWPGRVSSRIAFDPPLARRVFAGADFLVMPSRDEPCGLTQLYAMRYGAIPVVAPVGGLRDTVQPLSLAYGTGTGIVAARGDPPELLLACEDAFDVWRDPIAMTALVARAMARDSSWGESARKYLAVYEGRKTA